MRQRDKQYKRWVLGTYRRPPADPQPYLDEFCFRAEFSGRRDAAFGALLAAVVRPRPTTVRVGAGRRRPPTGGRVGGARARTSGRGTRRRARR